MNEQNNNEISVRVLFFGGARDTTGASSLELTLQSPARLSDATKKLFQQFPGLERFGKSLLFAVNQEYAVPETAIKADDELAVLLLDQLLRALGADLWLQLVVAEEDLDLPAHDAVLRALAPC